MEATLAAREEVNPAAVLSRERVRWVRPICAGLFGSGRAWETVAGRAGGAELCAIAKPANSTPVEIMRSKEEMILDITLH